MALLKGKSFKLASGATSSFFFNMKPITFEPEAISIMADEIAQMLLAEKDKTDFVGGLELGSIPIVSAVCARSWELKSPIQGFFVRKAVKDHGTKKMIEGNIREGANVTLIEDVTTTAGSVLTAIQELGKVGCKVNKVITIVDRCAGARENLKKEGIELVPMFTADDFKI